MRRTGLFLSLVLMFLMTGCGLLPSVIPSGPTSDILLLIIAATQTAAMRETQTAGPDLTTPQNLTPIPAVPQTETNTPWPTFTPIPTETPFIVPTVATLRVGPTATAIPPKTAAPPCNRVEVQDLNVEPGTDFAPSEIFVKTWRFKNVGSCTWNTSYSLVFSSGNQLDGPGSVSLPKSVPPGQSVDMSLNLKAPSSENNYLSYWMLKNDYGNTFGIGSSAKDPFVIEIDVLSYLPAAYHFARRTCEATWTSAAGTLPCPGAAGDQRGYVIKIEKPRLETGAFENEPVLLTHPQMTGNGYISGKFPAYTVQSGDHFYTVLSCQYGAKACDVIFRLNYQVAGTSAIQTLKSWNEKTDDAFTYVDIDLTPLAGQSIHFILTVEANGAYTQDEAIWLAPIIKKP